MLIGWSHADITPDRPVNLRGQFNTRISQYVHDPIGAAVLALENPDTGAQAVMVGCDLVAVPGTIQDRICQAVADRIPDFDTEMLFINATHTHTAPTLEEGIYPPDAPPVLSPTAYQDFFVATVADAVVAAWQGRKPGGISWALGHAVVGHNRRLTYADGSSKMYGDSSQDDFECVEGYEDHSLDMLFTWDGSDALTGVVINIACPSQVTEGDLFVSSDYWHETRQELAQRLGPDVFVMPQCSAAGDQSPHLLLHKRAEFRMLEMRGLTERQEIGRRIADGVEDVLPFARADIRRELPFEHKRLTVELPIRRISAEQCEACRAELERLLGEEPPRSDTNAYSRWFIMCRRNRTAIERYEAQQSEPVALVEIHVLRIGDIAVATNQFELFLDFGLRMKSRSKALQTFVVQLTASRGDGNGGTYLPTHRAVAGHSYGAEPVDNRIGPEGGQALVEGTLAAINAMFEG